MSIISEYSTETGSSTCTVIENTLEGEHGPMRYWVSKERNGPPILLIHGYGALIEHWRPVMPCITAQHTLYAMDLYGFGFSTRPNAPPTKELWARQVADLIRQVIGEPTIVVGHSMGGVVAAQAAYDFPELVRGVVLVNSGGLPSFREPTVFDRVFFSAIQIGGVGELLANTFATSWGVRQGLLSSYYRKELVDDELVQTFLRPLQQPDGVRYYLATSRNFEKLVLAIQPGEVQAPVMLLWGECDDSVPPKVAHAFKQKMFPQAALHIIPESGHSPFDETPEAFCEALLSWTQQLNATPG